MKKVKLQPEFKQSWKLFSLGCAKLIKKPISKLNASLNKFIKSK